MNFRKIIKNLLLSSGYHLMRRYYYDFDGNRSIRSVFDLAKIELDSLVILDVGANIGQSVDRFREFSKRAHIYSFEANPDVFELLIKKMESDKYLNCFNLGIGSENGTLKFNIQPDSGSSSFFKMDTESEAFSLNSSEEAKKNYNKTTPKQAINFNSEIDVNVKTLDSLFEDSMPTLVGLLKIDTQGYEEEVLIGASKILNRTLIVEAEVMFSGLYEKSSSLHGIQRILEKHGFVLWDIPYIGKFPDEKMNRINFIDAMFVNQKILDEKRKLT